MAWSYIYSERGSVWPNIVRVAMKMSNIKRCYNVAATLLILAAYNVAATLFGNISPTFAQSCHSTLWQRSRNFPGLRFHSMLWKRWYNLKLFFFGDTYNRQQDHHLFNLSNRRTHSTNQIKEYATGNVHFGILLMQEFDIINKWHKNWRVTIAFF